MSNLRKTYKKWRIQKKLVEDKKKLVIVIQNVILTLSIVS